MYFLFRSMCYTARMKKAASKKTSKKIPARASRRSVGVVKFDTVAWARKFIAQYRPALEALAKK